MNKVERDKLILSYAQLAMSLAHQAEVSKRSEEVFKIPDKDREELHRLERELNMKPEDILKAATELSGYDSEV